MKIELDSRFQKRVKGMFEKYEFEVGILDDTAHKPAAPKEDGLKLFHGVEARKVDGAPDAVRYSTSYISEQLRARMKVNYLVDPFKKRSSDIIKFSESFFRAVAGGTEMKRCVNLIQAIVRNPILRGDYGSNSPGTIKEKGFNHFGIDTGQLFQAIKARVRIRHV
jgi:hypothetical protein